MILTVLMIVSDNQEPFSFHETAIAAWVALVGYVNDNWTSRFRQSPVPIQPEDRVGAFFDHADEFYALGEADMSKIKPEPDND